MKKAFTLILILSFVFSLSAQDDEGFVRNGKWVIETGTSIFTSGSGGTGGSILFADGSTFTQIGLDIGKFVSEDFVVKGRLGILNTGGNTLNNISIGGKYYLGGMAPIEVNAGIITGFGTAFLGDIHLGYAFALADNIYFEPKAGVIVDEETATGSIKFTFAMIF